MSLNKLNNKKNNPLEFESDFTINHQSFLVETERKIQENTIHNTNFKIRVIIFISFSISCICFSYFTFQNFKSNENFNFLLLWKNFIHLAMHIVAIALSFRHTKSSIILTIVLLMFYLQIGYISILESSLQRIIPNYYIPILIVITPFIMAIIHLVNTYRKTVFKINA